MTQAQPQVDLLPAESDPLSPDELARLRACENIIFSGLQSFNDVGSALMRVRDQRLYRASGTFEDYCEKRWRISRPRAYALISAADVVSSIGRQTPDLPAPTNERQARELAKAPEPDRGDVWRDAHKATDGKPTADAIRNARERRSGQVPEPKPGRTPAEAAEIVANVASVADKVLGPDEVAIRLDLQRRFRLALDGVKRITDFGVNAVADGLDDDDFRSLELKATALIDFYNDAAAARRKPANVLFMKPKVVAS